MKKLICWLTILSFSFTMTASQAEQILLEQTQGAPAALSTPFPTPPFLTLPPIQLLPDAGKVEEIFYPEGDSQKTSSVYLIQDAHESMDAQENICRIIKQLVKSEGVSLVCFEGGSGKLDKSFYTLAGHPELNQRVIDRLFEEGEIGGLEKSALDLGEQVHFYGIEEEGVYFENIHSMQRVYALAEKTESPLKEIETIFNRLRGRLFLGDVKKIRAAKKAFDEQKIALIRYAGEVTKWADKYGGLNLKDVSSQDRWPQMVRLVKLLEFEEKLEKNKQEIGNDLVWAENETKNSPVNFVWDPSKYGKVKGHVRWYFERMVDDLTRQGVVFENHPNLKNWIGYQIIQDELDGAALFEELEQLEKILFDGLALGKETKTFIELEDDWELLKKFVQMQVSRPEWEAVKMNRERISPAGILERLDRLSGEVMPQDTGVPSGNIGDLTALFQTAVENYTHVERRDAILSEKTLEQIRTMEEGRKAILIVGGFHTPRLLPFLKSNDIGYVIITPVIRDFDRKLNYREQIDPEAGMGKKKIRARSTRQPVLGTFGKSVNALPHLKRWAEVRDQILKNEIKIVQAAKAASLGEEAAPPPQAPEPAIKQIPTEGKRLPGLRQSRFLTALVSFGLFFGVGCASAVTTGEGMSLKNISQPDTKPALVAQQKPEAAIEIKSVISAAPVISPLSEPNPLAQVEPPRENLLEPAVTGIVTPQEMVVSIKKGDQSSWISLDLGKVRGGEGSVLKDSPFISLQAGLEPDIFSDPSFVVSERFALTYYHLVGEAMPNPFFYPNHPDKLVKERDIWSLGNYLGAAKAVRLDEKGNLIVVGGAAAYLQVKTEDPGVPLELAFSGMVRYYLSERNRLELFGAHHLEMLPYPYSTGALSRFSLTPGLFVFKLAYEHDIVDDYLSLRLEPFYEDRREKRALGIEASISLLNPDLSLSARYEHIISRHPLIFDRDALEATLSYGRTNPEYALKAFGTFSAAFDRSRSPELAFVTGLEFEFGGRESKIRETGVESSQLLSGESMLISPQVSLERVSVDTRPADPKTIMELGRQQGFAARAGEEADEWYIAQGGPQIPEQILNLRNQLINLARAPKPDEAAIQAVEAQIQQLDRRWAQIADGSREIFDRGSVPPDLLPLKNKLDSFASVLRGNPDNPEQFFNQLRGTIHSVDDLSLLLRYLGGRLNDYHYDDSYIGKFPLRTDPFSPDIVSWTDMLPLLSESLRDFRQRPRIHSRTAPLLLAQLVNALRLPGTTAYAAGVSATGVRFGALHGIVLVQTPQGILVTDWRNGFQIQSGDFREALAAYQGFSGLPGLIHVISNAQGKILFYYKTPEELLLERVGSPLKGGTLQDQNRMLLRKAADAARVGGRSLGMGVPAELPGGVTVSGEERGVFGERAFDYRAVLSQKYGNSLLAILAVVGFAAGILSLDLRNFVPEIYAQVSAYQTAEWARSAKNENVISFEQSLESIPRDSSLRQFLGYLETKQPALVVTGPISPEVLAMQAMGEITVVVYYRDEAYKNNFDSLSKKLIDNGILSQEKLDKHIYLLHLPTAGLSEEDFFLKFLKGKSIEFNGNRRRSIQWLKRDGGLKPRDQAAWQAGDGVINAVLHSPVVQKGLPLTDQELSGQAPEDKLFSDLLKMALMVRLAHDPEGVKKEGYVKFENNRYSPTERFAQFFKNVVMKAQIRRLVAAMA